MLIGAIADDFTGASDIANTLAKGLGAEGGLKTAQYSGVPQEAAAGDIEAGVISLKSRSAPIEEAVEQSLEALKWFQAQGCQQIIFKYCSTFDSTPDGNIGPVAEALLAALGARSSIVCPAFPTAGRTIYNGHLFVFDQLLSESGMQHHPLTPMTDPDIRRWLSRQCTLSVGHIALPMVLAGPKAVKDQIEQCPDPLIVADAVTDQDLITLGAALKDAALITGGSGIALGLPRNFIRAGQAKGGGGHFMPVTGPEAILAGSCSGATRNQIELHAQTHPVLAINVPDVMAGKVTPETLCQFAQDHVGRAPLAYSSGDPEQVRAMQARFGREAVSNALDDLFAETASRLVAKGFRRIVVAGGETSGAVARAVAISQKAPAMNVGPEIDPGVPILSLGAQSPVAIALKSGNFGAPDFFSKALRMMEGA